MNGDLSTSGIVSQSEPDVPSGLLDKLPDWKIAMQSAIRDAAQLCQALGLPESLAAEAQAATGSFPVFVPWELLSRIKPADPTDPILLQVIPRPEELGQKTSFSRDPVGDRDAEIVSGSGLLQKYAGRALWIMTGTCPVHCRYCFRRHFEYHQHRADLDQWSAVCDWLNNDRTIDELILSGGDPLTSTDDRLSRLVHQLDHSVPSLRRLRIHSRMPVTIPQRVTRRLVRLFADSRFSTVMVIHANHAQEIDNAVAEAVTRMMQGGIPVLNQSVLLSRVNDSLERSNHSRGH